MALGLAQLWHYIYDFQLVWDMGGKHTRIMAGKDKSWRYFTLKLKIPQMEHGFQSQQLHSAHCSNRYITLFILELRWLTSALFVSLRATEKGGSAEVHHPQLYLLHSLFWSTCQPLRCIFHHSSFLLRLSRIH